MLDRATEAGLAEDGATRELFGSDPEDAPKL